MNSDPPPPHTHTPPPPPPLHRSHHSVPGSADHKHEDTSKLIFYTSPSSLSMVVHLSVCDMQLCSKIIAKVCLEWDYKLAIGVERLEVNPLSNKLS